MSDAGIVFVGDIHRRWDYVVKGLAALPAPPRAVVLLGDMECHRPLDELVAPILDAGVELHWICGNHDYDGGPEMWRNLCDPALNPRTHGMGLNGVVREIGGLRIGGLSGTFRSRVWLPPHEPRLTHRRQMAEDCLTIGPGWSEAQCLAMGEALNAMAIWPEDAEALVTQGCDVLVTHEAPSSHPMGSAALDALARAAGAKLIIHGHHHCNYRLRASDGLVVQAVAAGWGVDLDGRAWWPGEAERWFSAAIEWERDATHAH